MVHYVVASFANLLLGFFFATSVDVDLNMQLSYIIAQMAIFCFFSLLHYSGQKHQLKVPYCRK